MNGNKEYLPCTPKSGSLRKMRSSTLFALLLCWISSGCAQQPTVWILKERDQIGGHVVTTSGAPDIVEEEGGRSTCFKGEPDAALLDLNPITGLRTFTIEVLIKPRTAGSAEQRFLHIEDARAARVLMELRIVSPQEWALDTFLFDSQTNRLTLLDRTKLHSTDEWHWVALTYDGTTMAHFVDGVRELEGPLAFRAMEQGRMSLGVRLNKVSWYQGCIREVRFTPRALAAPQLQATRAH
jgi:Concanavalin A-like lectin/glucanases superfamily